MREDDTSYPPIDLESPFFAEQEHGLHDVHDLHHDVEERDPRMVLKRAPQTAQRRARFQRYVKLAVAAASALCLAALVKGAVAHNQVAEPPRKAAATFVAPPPVAQAAAVAPTVARAPSADEVPPPPEATAPPPEATAPAPTPSAAPAAAQAPAPVDSQAAPVASQAAAAEAAPAAESAPLTEPDPKAAAKEKHASQLALERGKVAESIEAGERSVALDPTDAEAWLILGAAYQQKGDQAKARQTFHACLQQGKRGPKWECAQFPH
jgi:tetratricopeptide (TPR) repeat protein